MGFIRRLFGGGGGKPRDTVFYVRPKRCEEIVAVRIDLYNEPSQTDDGGYFLRKIVRGERCPFPAELHLNFDQNRRLIQVGVENGETVDESDYRAWLAERDTPKG